MPGTVKMQRDPEALFNTLVQQNEELHKKNQKLQNDNKRLRARIKRLEEESTRLRAGSTSSATGGSGSGGSSRSSRSSGTRSDAAAARSKAVPAATKRKSRSPAGGAQPPKQQRVAVAVASTRDPVAPWARPLDQARPWRLLRERDPRTPVAVARDPSQWSGINWEVERVTNHTLLFAAFEVKFKGWGHSWNESMLSEDCADCADCVNTYLADVPCWGGGAAPMRFKLQGGGTLKIVAARAAGAVAASLTQYVCWLRDFDRGGKPAFYKAVFVGPFTGKGTRRKRVAKHGKGRAPRSDPDAWVVKLLCFLAEDGEDRPFATRASPEVRNISRSWLVATEGESWGLLRARNMDEYDAEEDEEYV